MKPVLLAFLLVVGCTSPPAPPPAADTAEAAEADFQPAFPGAQGWGAATPGGRGGHLLHVTTLAADGPGSLAEALQTPGPRIVVFEVGGVIDLAGTSLTVAEPYVTVAGQTAPSPGITLIRGGLRILTHDVVVQHLRVRPGEAGHAKESGWEVDGIVTANSAHDVLIDHCSISWATDENLSASGPRFDGGGPDAWRRHTSHRIIFSNNLIAEALSRSTHSKGEHSKGSLIHDNVTDILIVGNLYASNVQRNPYFKGGVRGVVANNLIVNPRNRAVHYRLVPSEWEGRPYQTGRLVLVGNVLRHGADTHPDVPLFAYIGPGDLDLYAADNLAIDREGRSVAIVKTDPRGGTLHLLDTRPSWPGDDALRPAAEVEAYVLQNAGARPWDRDAIDRRIIRQIEAGTTAIIDSEAEVGGYPAAAAARQAFDPAAWDLTTMTRRRP